jgi:SAM-dependent methyltransferase
LLSPDRKEFLDPEILIGFLEPHANHIFLDYGVGNGFLAIPLSKKVKQVLGYDISEKMLELLGKQIRQHRLRNIHILPPNTPFPRLDQKVDGIIFSNVIHEFTSLKPLIPFCVGSLKKGGKILIVDWDRVPGPSGPPQEHRVSPKKIEQLFGRNFTLQKRRFLRYHYVYLYQNTKSK